MMGRGAEGGCGTQEKFFRPVYRVSSQQRDQSQNPLGFPEQARKALAERCPFDSTDDSLLASRVPTLPVGLADLLSKYSQTSRSKRHKKSDSQTPSQTHAAQPSGSTGIWAETEDYFRPVTFSDVENLLPLASPACLASQLCFSISSICTAPIAPNTSVTVNCESSCVGEVKKDDNNEQHQHHQQQEQQQCMDIDDGDGGAVRETEIPSLSEPPPQPQPQLTSQVESSQSTASGIEWLLGSRNKILLTSERPSKKRKLLGSDAGLDKLRVERPYGKEPNLHLCHLCCLGDLDQLANQLLVCDFCKVAVHQRCYGVQAAPLGPWLCSWCKCGNTGVDVSDLSSRPCLLCPKPGGALKPMEKDDSEGTGSGSMKFAHLVCSQWLPEVYVEDTQTMEPVMNFKGIKDTRLRLVCNLCKVKHGACIRCSHGTCRTAFHPICAREAGNRLEIWGKNSCESVELRAFCSKHSDLQVVSGSQQSNVHPFVAVDSNSSEPEHLPLTWTVNKPPKLKIGLKNGEKSVANVSNLDATSGNLENSDILLGQDTDPTSNVSHGLQDLGEEWSRSMETPSGDNRGSSLDVVGGLKKLVDRGKVTVTDVALEIGLSSELLVATLAGDRLSTPDLHHKLLKWFKNHVYMGAPPQNLKGGDSVAILSKAVVAGLAGPNSVATSSQDNPSATFVKSVSPRAAKNCIKVLKDSKVVGLHKAEVVQKNGNGTLKDDRQMNPLVPNGNLKENGTKDRDFSLDRGFCSTEKECLEKILYEPLGHQDMGSSVRESGVREAELANGCTLENNQAEVADASVQGTLTKSNGQHSASSVDVGTSAVPSVISGESSPCSFVHPFIQKRLMQFKDDMFVKDGNQNRYGPKEKDNTSEVLKLEQVVKARNMGILELSPADEVEGQLVYLQNKLLDHATASRNSCDELLFSVVKALPDELDATTKQRWDSVLVNQYLCGLREAKKQGRKEKRHKEAQAVLAAATAAAAASSRISSFRKDVHEEASQPEVPLKVMPRAKETLSRLAVTRVSSEKPSGILQLKANTQLCDICRRPETILNPILVCCNCKVPVHLTCYRGVKDPSVPFYCDLCEEIVQIRALPINSREEFRVLAHCGLCGGTTGAFRKSRDGQWVHAFCAEWLLESAFRRGQPNLVEGMETILRETEVCCICYRKIGSCVKCNFGNCQSTFHPSCARNTGFYMHIKTGGGKLQHKAYCEKHSLEQREKAEAQQYGPEELRGIKQIRVELERVRLLCERIIRREKLKRELVLCSHDILASKRDSVAFSVLFRSPFFLTDVSSESATTSLRGHVDDNRSCNEVMQRSEDVTMDSAISGKRRITVPSPIDVDQKTDDSSTSQHHCTRTPTDRVQFSGKQLPHRPVLVVSRNLAEDLEKKSKSRKHTETFQKELVMTSDQASLQNQRLPKGFAYVPVLCLPKEKPAVRETGSLESVEPDG